MMMNCRILVICSQIIGNGNLIMGSCHIAHDCKLGNNNILANGTLLGGHVVLKVIKMENHPNLVYGNPYRLREKKILSLILMIRIMFTLEEA